MIKKDFASISELLAAFPNNEASVDYLEELRWPGHIVSPYDATSKVNRSRQLPKLYLCWNTKKYFNVKTKTMFAHSKIGLQKWLIAIWYYTHEKDISCKKLASDMKVSFSTAAYAISGMKSAGIEKFSDIERVIRVDDYNKTISHDFNDVIEDYGSVREQLHIRSETFEVKEDFSSISKLLEAFPNREACVDYLEELRWHGHIASPYDATSKVHMINRVSKIYVCKNTKMQFNVKTKTMFEHSKIGLLKWFMAIWYYTHEKNISPEKLASDIKLTLSTAKYAIRSMKRAGIKKFSDIESVVRVDEYDKHLKAMSKQPTVITERVAELVNNGKNIYEIMEVLNLKGAVVYGEVEKARKAGLIEKQQPFIGFANAPKPIVKKKIVKKKEDIRR